MPGRICTALAARLFREMTPRTKVPSLGFGGALIVVAVIVLGVVILYVAATAGAYVFEACVSRTAFRATKSLAVNVVPFLPHSIEGGRLIAGGDFDQFHAEEGNWEWPGLKHAYAARNSEPDGPGTTTPLWDSYVSRSISWDDFKPPLEFHALAALIALALCAAVAWLARKEQHRIRSVQLVFTVGLALIVVTLPAAFAAWSGPQLVRIFWEQVYGVSGNNQWVARDRVWVQPALCETAGMLFFGIVYAICMLGAAWPAAKYLVASGVPGQRIMTRNGTVCCGRCRHQLDDLATCPECGLSHNGLPPRLSWNWRWLRTRRTVALLLLVGIALLVSAALPLIVGVAQVLYRRL